MTEILRPEQYEEYEAFCQNHPRGGFTQSTRWFQVKNNWKGEVVVVRDAAREGFAPGVRYWCRSCR